MINRTALSIAVRVVLSTAIMLSAASSHAAEKPIVVATFSVLADMVANVAEDHVELATIVGPDGDSEEQGQSRPRRSTPSAAQVVLICGEPGIGKSRISETIRERVSARPSHRYVQRERQ
jgi:hypothetical protein